MEDKQEPQKCPCGKEIVSRTYDHNGKQLKLCSGCVKKKIRELNNKTLNNH